MIGAAEDIIVSDVDHENALDVRWMIRGAAEDHQERGGS